MSMFFHISILHIICILNSIAWAEFLCFTHTYIYMFHTHIHLYINVRIYIYSKKESYNKYLYMYIEERLPCDRYHHHDVVTLARISLTLSHHFSLSFIASGRSSGLHPVSLHSCCMYVLAGRPAFARPYVGFHRSTSLIGSSLLLQQCPACLVRLTWIVSKLDEPDKNAIYIYIYI